MQKTLRPQLVQRQGTRCYAAKIKPCARRSFGCEGPSMYAAVRSTILRQSRSSQTQAKVALSLFERTQYASTRWVKRETRVFPTAMSTASQNGSPVEPLEQSASTFNDLAGDVTKDTPLSSLGFSSGGLLFPYHWGVYKQLREMGMVTDRTIVAGSSGGSLVAAAHGTGIDMSVTDDAIDEVFHQCRTGGTRFRLREVVESVLRDIMPEDAHEKVKHKAYIGVTLLQTPVPRCSLFNNFNDRDDFIQALLASCYIPVYFDQGKMGMRYRDRWVCDGGISNFVPTPPGEAGAVKVACWPDTLGIWDISLSTFRRRSPYSHARCLTLALTPGSPEVREHLEELGREDALRFVESRSLWDRVPLVQRPNPTEMSASSSNGNALRKDSTTYGSVPSRSGEDIN